MIQRIQSVWLLLAALTLSGLIFLPLATSNLTGAEFQVLAAGLYQKVGSAYKNVEPSWSLLCAVIAVVCLCFVTIFNFKNRKLQKRISFLIIILIIGLSFLCSRYAQKIPGGMEISNLGTGMYLPPLAIVFCLMAIRGINRDEQLLRSADRLR